MYQKGTTMLFLFFAPVATMGALLLGLLSVKLSTPLFLLASILYAAGSGIVVYFII